MGYSALVYCNTFFGEANPTRRQSFCQFVNSDNAIPQCNNSIKTLCFLCLMCFPHSIQAFMHFQSIFGLLRIYIWTTSD